MPFKRPTCLASPDHEGKGHVAEEDLQVVPARVEEIPDEEKGTCVVNLLKTAGSGLGLTVSGGSDRDGKPRVSNLRCSGIAAKSDLLQVGDFITLVNGIRTSKLKHGEIISLLKNVGEKVTLEIDYRLPPTTVQTTKIVQKTTNICLKKSGESLGFVLRGGSHDQHCKSRPLVVTHIRPDSPCEREGSLKTGDRILAVGGINLLSLTLEDAIAAINANSGEEVILTIEYDVSVMDAVANASGPLLVEIKKTPGADLGIILARSTHRKKTVMCIDRIKAASISDRCGALHVGDQILSIDNLAMSGGSVSVREASEMLQSASDEVKLEILPVSHLAITGPGAAGQNRFAPFITSAQSMTALNSQRVSRYHGNTIGGYGGRGSNRWNRKRMPRPKHSASATCLAHELSTERGRDLDRHRAPRRSAFLSLVSTDYLSGNQVVHTEVCEVQLLTADDCYDAVTSAGCSSNFGIQLQGSVFTTEILSSPLISYIEPERAADKSGVVQAGDRIMSINGCPCEECTVDEVYLMLSEAYCAGQAILEIEFDVAESVVPSSGTFHAKLPKRRGVDVGIVVTSASGRYNDDALMISEIKQGSVAHRTGTLGAGDRLLAIDGVRLEGCTPEDAHALLASAEDVVRLKIQKDEENSEEADTSGAITYTVELKRYGGALGITISGTEERFDPIVISGITPGGLAARTGAIHVDDKILSINNVSLRAKPLSEAISLLQNAGESVNLKIRRQLSDPEPKSNAQQSRDRFHENFASSLAPSTLQRNQILNEAISELSDPEDDILPPPMGPLPDHIPSSRETPDLRPTSAWKDRGIRPGPAGAPSIDSAVESWEDSSADTQRTRSSAGSHQKQGVTSPSTYESRFDAADRSARHFSPDWKQSSTMSRLHKRNDVGSSRLSKLRERFEVGSCRTYSDTWGTREQIRARNYRSPEQSKSPVADWLRALEDLQSVGQSDYMQDLEDKMTVVSLDRNRQQSTASNRRLTSPYESYGASSKSDFNAQPLSSPLQIHTLTLIKNNRSEDFGFSMSDGQLEKGVYVHKIRPNGPAHRAGVLPYDRILQVNGQPTQDADCRMAVPLVEGADLSLMLLISRHPASTIAHLQRRPLLSTPHQ